MNATNVVVSTLTASSIVGVSFGATGPTGPIGQVAQNSYTAAGTSQTFTGAASPVPVVWTTADLTQTTGSTLIASLGNGLFQNNNSVTVPVLIEYTLYFNSTGGGSSYINMGPSNSNYALNTNYALNFAMTNQNTVSFTILIPAGYYFFIMYNDANTVSLQPASRLSYTLLVAGQQGATGQTGTIGPTGPVGQSAVLSATPSTTQAITSNMTTIVNWGTGASINTDATQSTGITGLTYNNGVFTNGTANTIPVLVEYTIILNASGSGSTYIGVNGGTNTFGTLLTTTNIFTNSFSVLLTPGSTVAVYYTDSGNVTIQTSSRITLVLLTAGSAGATGYIGPTGPVGQVTSLSVYPTTSQSILANTPTVINWGSTLSSQTTGQLGVSYAAGLFTNITNACLLYTSPSPRD